MRKGIIEIPFITKELLKMSTRKLTREEAVQLFEVLNKNGFLAQVYKSKENWIVMVEEKTNEDNKDNKEFTLDIDKI